MPITQATRKKAKHCLQTLNIAESIIQKSSTMHQKTKDAFLALIDNDRAWIQRGLKNDKLLSTSVDSLINGQLVYWKESAGTDTELFWDQLQRSDIPFERRDILRYALDHGRFRNVHEGMSARQDWDQLKVFPRFTNRFSQVEIKKLDEIITKDEKTRVQLLRKCLVKQAIPQTQYLKFGDCMGYLHNCNLFDLHFSSREQEELMEIWNRFEGK